MTVLLFVDKHSLEILNMVTDNIKINCLSVSDCNLITVKIKGNYSVIH